MVALDGLRMDLAAAVHFQPVVAAVDPVRARNDHRVVAEGSQEAVVVGFANCGFQTWNKVAVDPLRYRRLQTHYRLLDVLYPRCSYFEH